MTKNQEKKILTTQHDVIEASKTFVTQTRTLAHTLREAMWAPWIGAVEENEVATMWVTPWVNMTRAAHDRWLDMYETNVHSIIERSQEIVKHI